MDLLEQGGTDFRIIATANSTKMVWPVVAAGIGVSLLNMRPRTVLPHAGGEIRCLPISGATLGVTLSIGFTPGPKRRLVQLFVDQCTAFFAGPKAAPLIVHGECSGMGLRACAPLCRGDLPCEAFTPLA